MNLIQQLLQAGILQPDELIRARVLEEPVEGRILASGRLCVAGVQYDSVDGAMLAVLGSDRSGFAGSSLQFWSWFNPGRGAWVPLEHARAELAVRQHSPEVKTSASDPLRIDAVTVPDGRSRIGMTICPGKKGSGLYAGQWRRQLGADLAQIKAWGGQTLITLLEAAEFDLLGVPELGIAVNDCGLCWWHLPIKDMSTPNREFDKNWANCRPRLIEQLKQGMDIVIHCRGGLGRSGLLAARILIEMGENPPAAITRVRAAREHAIETYEQEEYLLFKKWEKLP